MKRKPIQLWAITATIFGWDDEEPDTPIAGRLMLGAIRARQAEIHVTPLRYGKEPGIKVIRAKRLTAGAEEVVP
jgi:hypothetical protein